MLHGSLSSVLTVLFFQQELLLFVCQGIIEIAEAVEMLETLGTLRYISFSFFPSFFFGICYPSVAKIELLRGSLFHVFIVFLLRLSIFVREGNSFASISSDF